MKEELKQYLKENLEKSNNRKKFFKKFPLLLNRWVAISFQHIMLLSYIGSRTMYMAETIII